MDFGTGVPFLFLFTFVFATGAIIYMSRKAIAKRMKERENN